MDTDFISRKHVSFDQMNGLLDFLQSHQDLAKGLTRGRRGKLYSLKLWDLCAKKLNAYKEGAVKDRRGWSKYWCDWKYRVRRKALELKAAKDNNQSPPEGIIPLSHMEDCILGLIGEHAVEGVLIKSDPLGDEDSDEEEPDNESFNNDVDDTTPIPQYERRKSSRSRKRPRSRDLSDVDDGEESCPPELKPRTNNVGTGVNHSDYDEDASEFLRLEKEKLENSVQMVESIRSIASEISGLRDVMIQIRDVLVNNRINM